MLMRLVLGLGVVALSSSCAHSRLSAGDLDRARRPAFIARIEIDAGPRSEVFQEDSAYNARLKQLSRKEGDRRLASKLAKGMPRFEVAERVRATTTAMLLRTEPWTHTVPPANVARVLESFLVEEVPANQPDYKLLKTLGADSVVEFVIERYGMRSEKGQAGTFVEGYGRMFFIDGGEIWHRKFTIDQLDAKAPGVDPFAVAKKPEMFRQEIGPLLDAVAEQFAKDLTPPGRRGAPSKQGAGELEDGGDVANPQRNESQVPVEEDPL